MKSLLVEVGPKYSLNNKSAIVLLPSGAIELTAGEPANLIIEKKGLSYSVRLLTANDLASFKMIKEVEISGRLIFDVLEYRNAKIEYERRKVGLRNRLFSEMVDANCDALTFLDLGSIAL